ncbi:STAS domain-containing protein [Streptomyces sp. NPDC098789]|uniref:STAS domain-containing protein n=1 Tax=Streptomyces sp. NPDC098789 TaxID=3366098 RepID=UPI0038193E8E
MDVPAPQSVTVVTRHDVTVVTVTGDLDLDHVDALRAVLPQVCTGAGAPARVVIDLARLSFCDSTGLNALLQARLMCVASGRTLALSRPGPQMSRLLSITGADTLFEVAEPGEPAADGAEPSAPSA